MKASRLSFLILSLPAVALLFPYSAANAALRVNNSSLMKNQAKVNAERAAMMQYEPQPARVTTNDNDTNISVAEQDMSACNSIYPNGQFSWAKPTSGEHRGGPATCVALVELRSYGASAGTSYTVLANTYLAAGDSMRCNIDDFSDITLAGRDYEYPADAAPTLEDVEKVMAQENKQNAGWKILGAAIVGGIGGNLVGTPDDNSDAALGLGKNKLKTTAIGAAGGAALMTASTQVDNYKAGSIILSTGMSAAAGAVAGNLLASGDDVLKIKDCKIDDVDKTCLYGTLTLDSSVTRKYSFEGTDTERAYLFYDSKNEYVYRCGKRKLVETNDGQTTQQTDEYQNCRVVMGIKITKLAGQAVGTQPYKDVINGLNNDKETYKFDTTTSKNTDDYTMQKVTSGAKGDFYKIDEAEQSGKSTPAMIVVSNDYAKKIFGYKTSDWSTVRQEIVNSSTKSDFDNHFYDLRGNVIKDVGGVKDKLVSSFHPSSQSADDGDMLDFGNKARTKSTLIGTGGGAALGAISGAAGANTAIQERWQTAQREYEDSLGNISCSTGQRFLSRYNDVIALPEMKKSEE